MSIRKIIKIDEEKCDGCGQCAIACVEGAIQIIDGKARLISESYCDGLGACIGECPQGAITLEERDAKEFDEDAVRKHIKGKEHEEHLLSCPSASPREIERCEILELEGKPQDLIKIPSHLRNWPIQIHLVPPIAPYLKNSELLIAADCTAFSFASFHENFIKGRVLLIGCPKLDNFDFYRKKLTEIFRQNDIKSVVVAHMEVPCCFGLVHLVHLSLKEAQKESIPLKLIKIGIEGNIIESKEVKAGGEE